MLFLGTGYTHSVYPLSVIALSATVSLEMPVPTTHCMNTVNIFLDIKTMSQLFINWHITGCAHFSWDKLIDYKFVNLEAVVYLVFGSIAFLPNNNLWSSKRKPVYK